MVSGGGLGSGAGCLGSNSIFQVLGLHRVVYHHPAKLVARGVTLIATYLQVRCHRAVMLCQPSLKAVSSRAAPKVPNKLWQLRRWLPACA